MKKASVWRSEGNSKPLSRTSLGGSLVLFQAVTAAVSISWEIQSCGFVSKVLPQQAMICPSPPRSAGSGEGKWKMPWTPFPLPVQCVEDTGYQQQDPEQKPLDCHTSMAIHNGS